MGPKSSCKTLTAPDTHSAREWPHYSCLALGEWRSCASSPPVDRHQHRIRVLKSRVFDQKRKGERKREDVKMIRVLGNML